MALSPRQGANCASAHASPSSTAAENHRKATTLTTRLIRSKGSETGTYAEDGKVQQRVVLRGQPGLNAEQRPGA
ncbi:hypothetical protein QFZ67_007695 [Streptomyces sp. V1I1]|nr:hypothetical protein [Streptomyces sp. V1I1]